MKANEAPEKIYIHKSQYYGLIANEHNITKNGIEYTRTDAFIEKVCEWLKDCATFTDMNGKKRIDKEMYKSTVEDFRKYIEGE
jgi:hypothetical protein